MIGFIIVFGLVALVWFIAIIRAFKSEAEEEEKRKGDKKDGE